MNSLNRRSFLAAGAAAATSVLNRTAAAADVKGSSSGPIVETTEGKIRGALLEKSAGKVNAFRGIPYGGSTEGANRFMPPVKPKAWSGVKDALDWGLEAPQGPHTEIAEVAATIPPQGHSEDCLRLNVWTSSANRNAKRPVMVWLHGGGFTSGSGSYSIYDGGNLARKHDVVTVSLNHRLNSFGFLYLPEIGGEKFAHASNAGILDVVAALEWVHDNIANFGGDPNNVTIFGQSGGAGKVSTLLAMPSAKGLFHRAIVQSGSNIRGIAPADATKSAQTLMSKLGVKTAEELQGVPMDRLVEATLAERGLRLGPVVDGRTLPGGPFDPTAPAISSDIPLLIGSVETEVAFQPNTPLDPMDDATLKSRVKQVTRADDAAVDNLIGLYRKGRPGSSNIDVYLILASDNSFRAGVLTEAERKAEQKAPVYMYYFTWRSPVRDGKLKAFHTLEIPFALANVDEGKSMTGSGQDRYSLQDKVSGAWAAFARSGNPNHKGLPSWPAFTNSRRSTMILNHECKVVDDPNREERLALAAARG